MSLPLLFYMIYGHFYSFCTFIEVSLSMASLQRQSCNVSIFFFFLFLNFSALGILDSRFIFEGISETLCQYLMA